MGEVNLRSTADISSMRDYEDEVFTDRDDIPLKESGSEGSDDEKQDYPPISRLAPILIGLCFQSFCIALVSVVWLIPQCFCAFMS
jgi:hypothetical protein